MKEELINYGLSEKETELYLACLKLGETSSYRLAELTNIKRSTIYDLTESLKKKGILTSFVKDKKTYFRAESPKMLIKMLKEKEDSINQIIPELEKISNSTKQKTILNIYEGISCIKNAAYEMLEAKEILVYGSSQMAEEVLKHFGENFARRRVERKITLKAILEPNYPEYMKDKKISKYTFVKKLKKFEGQKSAYFIYNDTLLTLTLGDEIIAVKIKNKDMVNFQREIFEFLWEHSNKD
ncbi:MAG: TrmB family transcriptional regulator [Nanoarchaeota archaeon]